MSKTNKETKTEERENQKKTSYDKRKTYGNGKPGAKGGKQDREWYKISDQVNNSIANLPFNRFPGTFEPIANGTLATGGTAGITTITNLGSNSTPGVLSLKYVCSYGGARVSSPASAVNVAAKAVYTWVRHQNSGHANYEAVDLMLYIMAMDEVYSEYLELKKILATATTYELVNRNIPDILLEAMGMNGAARDDLRANLANYRGRLNLLAAKISSMAVPNEFHVFKRRALLATTVFTDSESRLAQMYVFTKAGYRKYNPAYNTLGGGLEFHTPNNTTFGTRLDDLAAMIDVIISDDDMNIMSGDILKAYGRENLYVLAECDAAETVPIIFNEDVLQQIENTITAHVDLTSGNADISQSGGLVLESYQTTANGSEDAVANLLFVSGEVYLNSHKDEVAPDDVMEYSRLMTGVVYDPSIGALYFKPGSEIIVQFELVSLVYSTTGIPAIRKTAFETFVNNQTGGFGHNIVCTIDKFDWHPMLYVYSHPSGSNTISVSGLMGDVKKYTLVTSEDIIALNEVAVMGLLGALAVRNFNKR